MAKLWSYKAQRPGYAEVWVGSKIIGYVVRDSSNSKWVPLDINSQHFSTAALKKVWCHTRDDAARAAYAKSKPKDVA